MTAPARATMSPSYRSRTMARAPPSPEPTESCVQVLEEFHAHAPVHRGGLEKLALLVRDVAPKHEGDGQGDADGQRADVREPACTAA